MKKCRCKKCVEFRKNHSYEYLEIYGLYHTIAQFLLSRLKGFKKYTFSNPCNLTMKQWHKILDKMIFAFNAIAKDNRNKKNWDRVKEGLDLFNKYYFDLWI